MERQSGSDDAAGGCFHVSSGTCCCGRCAVCCFLTSHIPVTRHRSSHQGYVTEPDKWAKADPGASYLPAHPHRQLTSPFSPSIVLHFSSYVDGFSSSTMPTSLPFRDINVHASTTHYAFSSPSSPSAPTLVIDRPSGDLRLHDGKLLGAKRVSSIAGIMGIIRLRLGKNELVIPS